MLAPPHAARAARRRGQLRNDAEMVDQVRPPVCGEPQSSIQSRGV